MEKRFEFGYYTVARLSSTGELEHGLPFIALSDDLAKKLVHDAIQKDIAHIDATKFVLYRVGRFRPNEKRPIVLAKGDPLKVCTVGEIFGSLGEIVKVGEASE